MKEVKDGGTDGRKDEQTEGRKGGEGMVKEGMKKGNGKGRKER